MTHTDKTGLTLSARLFGYAGLLPQFICVVMVWHGGDYYSLGLAAGAVYSLLIFSFLGGVWWGQAVAIGDANARIYGLAVLPSLIAWGLFTGLALVWLSPASALICITFCIMLSPLIDRWLGYASDAFMQLRWHLSIGLGVLTCALGVLAQNAL